MVMCRLIVGSLVVTLAAGSFGCSGRPSLLPNPDRDLRKTSAEFAADAARRFPYPANAEPAGEAQARAQVGYGLNVVEVVNLSQETWEDVDVWVNRAYVVNVPRMEPNVLKRLNFQMIFNDQGQYFPLKKTMVERVELHRNGRLYNVPSRVTD